MSSRLAPPLEHGVVDVDAVPGGGESRCFSDLLAVEGVADADGDLIEVVKHVQLG